MAHSGCNGPRDKYTFNPSPQEGDNAYDSLRENVEVIDDAPKFFQEQEDHARKEVVREKIAEQNKKYRAIRSGSFVSQSALNPGQSKRR